MTKTQIAAMSLVALSSAGSAQTAEDAKAVASVQRVPILGVKLAEPKAIDHVRGVSVDFAPDQRTGRHQHPIPVVGYVVRGTVSFQIEGQPARTLRAGDAFYEPANVTIALFDNASSHESASFVGFYLMGAGEMQVVKPAP